MENIILWIGLVIAVGVAWIGSNVLVSRLIRRSDRATSSQKRAQIFLTWLIPGFFLYASWLHREFQREEELRNLAHPSTRKGGNSGDWLITGDLGFTASSDHGCHDGGDFGGDCGSHH